MSGSVKCRIQDCARTFYTGQAEATHFGKAHAGSQFNADLMLLSRLNAEYLVLTQDIKLAEERAETYQELADLTREGIRSRRLEAAILKDRITQVRLRFADLGIPLEVKQ